MTQNLALPAMAAQFDDIVLTAGVPMRIIDVDPSVPDTIQLELGSVGLGQPTFPPTVLVLAPHSLILVERADADPKPEPLRCADSLGGARCIRLPHTDGRHDDGQGNRWIENV